MTTTVVNIMNDPHTLYIGRCTQDNYRGVPIINPSRGFWGNPFVVGVDGNHRQCVVLYKEWLLDDPNANEHRSRLMELKHHTLGCHCVPIYACHGQLLAWLADHAKVESRIILPPERRKES